MMPTGSPRQKHQLHYAVPGRACWTPGLLDNLLTFSGQLTSVDMESLLYHGLQRLRALGNSTFKGSRQVTRVDLPESVSSSLCRAVPR